MSKILQTCNVVCGRCGWRRRFGVDGTVGTASVAPRVPRHATQRTPMSHISVQYEDVCGGYFLAVDASETSRNRRVTIDTALLVNRQLTMAPVFLLASQSSSQECMSRLECVVWSEHCLADHDHNTQRTRRCLRKEQEQDQIRKTISNAAIHRKEGCQLRLLCVCSAGGSLCARTPPLLNTARTRTTIPNTSRSPTQPYTLARPDRHFQTPSCLRPPEKHTDGDRHGDSHNPPQLQRSCSDLNVVGQSAFPIAVTVFPALQLKPPEENFTCPVSSTETSLPTEYRNSCSQGKTPHGLFRGAQSECPLHFVQHCSATSFLITLASWAKNSMTCPSMCSEMHSAHSCGTISETSTLSSTRCSKFQAFAHRRSIRCFAPRYGPGNDLMSWTPSNVSATTCDMETSTICSTVRCCNP